MTDTAHPPNEPRTTQTAASQLLMTKTLTIGTDGGAVVKTGVL